ncbi:MAG: GFA family protein [Gammaproteobacteria bacterium]
MTHKGSCHCGAVAFEAAGTPEKLVECNCSICSKRGSRLWFITREDFKLLTPEDKLATYTFNKHIIKHHFCPVCGCAPFAQGVSPTGKYMVAINTRCLDDVDLTQLPVTHFDGRSL